MIVVVDARTGNEIDRFVSYGEAVVFRRDVLGGGPEGFVIRGVPL